MPKRTKAERANPYHPYPPPEGFPSKEDLQLGAPKIQEILRCFARGDQKRGWEMVNDLNIFQLNQFHGTVMALQQKAENVQAITGNVMDFMLKYGEGAFKETRHIRLIGEYVKRAEQQNTPDLWISIPPGHGKSTSIGFWELISYMARFPKRHNAVIMHKYEKAEQRTRKIRNWIQLHGAKLGLYLDETSKSAGRFSLRTGGSLQAYGTGTGITGDRFDGLVVIDDPVKGQEMVRSADQRDNQWDWFLGEVLNRRDPGGKFVCIMTRWHEDDLCGRCLARSEEIPGAVKFDYLMLPAIASDDDILGRQPGEALWPERFPIEALRQIEATYTPFMWSALFQQNPTPDEGITFRKEWWQFYDHLPEHFDVAIQSWDLTFGDLQTSDYTVGVVMGRRGPHIYIVDVIRKKLDFSAAVEEIRRTSFRYPWTGAKLIERAANGWAATTMLQKEVPGIVPIPVKTSKDLRAQAVMPFIQSGNVWLPKTAPWLQEFLKELSQFGGGGKYDDQVDAFSQGCSFLMFGAYASREAAERAAQEADPPKTCVEIQTREFAAYTRRIMQKEMHRINSASLPPEQRWRYPSDQIVTPGGEVVR